MKHYWLSFVDSDDHEDVDAFLGVLIIEADYAEDAIVRAQIANLDPRRADSGEVAVLEVPEEFLVKIPDAYRGRVLDFTTVQALDDLIGGGGRASHEEVQETADLGFIKAFE